MKATDLLKQQHDEVKSLFKKIEAAAPASKGRIFEELAAKLVAHDGIERELFYPACEESFGMNDLLGEALVEHGLVEFSLFQADQAQGESDFDYKLTVLQEALEHHIDEEEGELFPKVSRALGKEALEALGSELEQKFNELSAGDFRTPLHANLQQVLQGAMKTSPAPKSASKARSKTSTKTAPARRQSERRVARTSPAPGARSSKKAGSKKAGSKKTGKKGAEARGR